MHPAETSITVSHMEATITTYSQGVAGNLRAEMARRGHAMADLAGALGVTCPTAADRFYGRKSLNVGELEQISTWLGVPVTALLPTDNRASAASEAVAS